MNALPFDTELRLPLTPFSGSVRLLLVPLPDDEPPSVALALEYNSARSILALFGAAVNAQMFNRTDDAACAWQAEPAAVDAQTLGIELNVRVENLPLYAWAHLFALLCKNHDALEPLRALSIVAEKFPATVSVSDVLQAVPQDLRKDKPDFEWQTVGTEKSRNIHLDLMFQAPIESAVRERVEDDLAIWLQLNILGAFDLEFLEAEDLDPLGRVQMTSSFRIECFVPYYRGDMSGFVALDCWLRNVHRHALPLEEASLE